MSKGNNGDSDVIHEGYGIASTSMNNLPIVEFGQTSSLVVREGEQTTPKAMIRMQTS